MLHKAYFSPRAAWGAEREISRTLECLAYSPVTTTIAEERAMAIPVGNNLFIHPRQVPARQQKREVQDTTANLKLTPWKCIRSEEWVFCTNCFALQIHSFWATLSVSLNSTFLAPLS